MVVLTTSPGGDHNTDAWRSWRCLPETVAGSLGVGSDGIFQP
jgi:hypothetical protein